jgi:diguanylate cyclase (GGDEF)-like protein
MEFQPGGSIAGRACLCAAVAPASFGERVDIRRNFSRKNNNMALLSSWRYRKPGGKRRDADSLERQLAEQEDFSQLLQDTADIVVFTQDENGRLISVNRHGRWLSGIDEPVSDQLFLDQLHHPAADLPARLEEMRSGRRSHYRHETPLIRANAEPLLLAWWHVPWTVRGTEERRIISIGLDISDQRLAEEHLGWLALHDPLTGLLNRRGFLERARANVVSGEPFALMLLDLDQFKDINDLKGHQHGDRLLQQVSRLLRQQLRQSDTIARLGGDEFGILLAGADAETVELAAGRCCGALLDIDPELPELGTQVTTSIGVVLYPDHGADVDQLLANADIALYQAKSRGRNAWHLFDGDDAHRARIHERVYWDQQVRKVLDRQTLEMHYQPIVSLDSREVTHHEALLRSRGEDGGFLRTDQLILAAEQNGQIHLLDEQVVTQVCLHLQNLQKAGINTCLAMNLSGLSFNNPNLVPHVTRCLKEFDITPQNVVFEITETAALADIDASIQVMEALRAQGCRFALDDFGVGFSSLYYLKKLPVDYIKIDGSFVRNLDTEKEHQVLIRALVDVARAFDLKTIAEFVEDQTVMDLLADLGVNYAQGYHIEKPRPFTDIWREVTDAG